MTPVSVTTGDRKEAETTRAIVDEQIPFVTGADETTCSWTAYFLGAGEPCWNRGTLVVTHGCVHEHLIRSLTCDDCLPAVRRTMDGGHALCTLCTPCRDRGGQDGVPTRIIRVEPLPEVQP